LHWIYALLKLPVALFTAACGLWLIWQFVKDAPAGVMPWATGVLAVPTLLACIYPLVLIIVLRSRTVREYYGDVRTAS
jgi:hypothetical protein